MKKKLICYYVVCWPKFDIFCGGIKRIYLRKTEGEQTDYNITPYKVRKNSEKKNIPSLYMLYN